MLIVGNINAENQCKKDDIAKYKSGGLPAWKIKQIIPEKGTYILLIKVTHEVLNHTITVYDFSIKLQNCI